MHSFEVPVGMYRALFATRSSVKVITSTSSKEHALNYFFKFKASQIDSTLPNEKHE